MRWGFGVGAVLGVAVLVLALMMPNRVEAEAEGRPPRLRTDRRDPARRRRPAPYAQAHEPARHPLPTAPPSSPGPPPASAPRSPATWPAAATASPWSRARSTSSRRSPRSCAAEGVRAEVIAADLTDRAARAGLLGAIEARGLTADVLVNNAGLSTLGPVAESDPEAEMAMVELDVVAVGRPVLAVPARHGRARSRRRAQRRVHRGVPAAARPGRRTAPARSSSSPTPRAWPASSRAPA